MREDMFGEKRYIDEKYADMLLQLAWKYKHENPDKKQSRIYKAMDRTLETMDKYVAFINNMGFMMYEESISYMAEYIDELIKTGCEFPACELNEAKIFLTDLICEK